MSVYRVIEPDVRPVGRQHSGRDGDPSRRGPADVGRIHSVETFGTLDGPGIRYVIFVQGCHLRCKYCQNRDTWPVARGTPVRASELVTDALRFRSFFDRSGGGVTVSGGDPILQARFVATLFEEFRAAGIHTALDTSGLGRISADVDRLVRATDLVLLDIKHIDSVVHRDLTGRPNELVLEFARYLAGLSKPIWIRHVIVPGYTMEPDSARRTAHFLASMENVERIELLRYHELGKAKWATMGEAYPLEGTAPPTDDDMDRIASVFRVEGLTVHAS